MRLPVLLSGLSLALFALAPGIDLWVSSLAWRPQGGFWLRDGLYARLWYEGVDLGRVVAIFGSILLFALWGVRRRPPLGVPPRLLVAFALTLALGAGLLVNAGLKGCWDRPRPRHVVEFGGDEAFSPVLLPRDSPESHASFASGHAAFVFAFYGLALAARRRRRAIFLVTVLGSMAGVGRILQGGHFASDVVFAGLLLYWTAFAVHRGLAVLWPAAASAPDRPTARPRVNAAAAVDAPAIRSAPCRHRQSA